MSHFTASAASALIAEVEDYARKCHFLGPKEPVSVQKVEETGLVILYFPDKQTPRTSVLVTDRLDGCDFYGEQVVFPAGGQHLPLLKRVALRVVHDLFDPS